MSQLLELAHHVVLAGPSPTPAAIVPNPAPQSPPGMDSTFSNFISWTKYVALIVGVISLMACAMMMMIGRRNRGHLATEGAMGLVWVLGGLSVVSLAVGIVTAMV